jgi:nucleoside-diphosphate-sugar epimerase
MLQPGKNVLIAGATGYLGQRLIKAYAEAGYSVRALARAPEKLCGCCQTNSNQSPLFPDEQTSGSEKLAPFKKSGVTQ